MTKVKKFKIFKFNYRKEDIFTGKYYDKIITGYLREYNLFSKKEKNVQDIIKEDIREISRIERGYFFQWEGHKLYVGCDMEGNILRKDEWVDCYNKNPIMEDIIKEKLKVVD